MKSRLVDKWLIDLLTEKAHVFMKSYNLEWIELI